MEQFSAIRKTSYTLGGRWFRRNVANKGINQDGLKRGSFVTAL